MPGGENGWAEYGGLYSSTYIIYIYTYDIMYIMNICHVCFHFSNMSIRRDSVSYQNYIINHTSQG